ncbi:MAG: SDR family NAD(P)-dependent oxidoreductase [Thermoleophilia bacterium]|nr:SDR family NAD(P)-dependent oxidoreductase [Thermoleophilia bacterium]
MNMGFSGKVAIVTGGGGGIGRATALALAREGAKVTLVDLDRELGVQTVRLIALAGGEAMFVECDVSKAEDPLCQDGVRRSRPENY